MMRKKVIFGKENGLHMKFALSFVKESSSFDSDIKLLIEDREYEAKSLLGVMSVIAVKGEEIIIQADGIDEQLAVDKLSELLESK